MVLLHGWEGRSESTYIQLLADTLYRQGVSIARLNFRDHGNTHHLNRGLFHSCRLDEVADAVRAVQDQWQPQQLFLAGFSLGGNFAIRRGQPGLSPLFLAQMEEVPAAQTKATPWNI